MTPTHSLFRACTRRLAPISLGLITLASPAWAKVSEAEAARLGKDLTLMGANPAANANATIPAWTGSMDGLPIGLHYHSGDVYPNPYAKEQALFEITASNSAQYAERLSEGQKAMFNTYPKTYKIRVFPSHRDGKINKLLTDRTVWNASHAELTNNGDGLDNYTGGVPFPIPQSGAEAIWNARVAHPHPIMEATFDEVAMFGDGNQSRRRSHQFIESPYAYSTRAVGTTTDEMGPVAAYVFAETLEPQREKGEMVIVHEPMDWVNNARNAWVYMPGARRVRRAPNVGYDTPVGPGGFATVDDGLGFNGALDRYEWKLVGKQEMYIPYHAYEFDNPAVTYDQLLTKFHPNPDHLRYELHRVWIVEASLKAGKRHLYAKRRFYIDEDSWLITMTDSYDGKGELWRTGIINTLYDYQLRAYISRAHINHDLVGKAYIAMRLVNESKPTNYAVEPKGAEFYTAGNLRKMGR